ncbi:MAG: STAS domain-containing protein [Spirochaetes bacterium]|nr:STAS domain-containing protein [Spirochaetota bacterium]
MELLDRAQDDVVIFEISGEVDIYNCGQIKNLFLDKLNSGSKKFLINLDKISYIDSSGIGVLIFIKTSVTKHKGELVLVNIKDSVKKIFDLTKLASYFTVREDLPAGVKYFKQK